MLYKCGHTWTEQKVTPYLKNEDGQLIGDVKEKPIGWVKYFEEVLNGGHFVEYS